MCPAVATWCCQTGTLPVSNIELTGRFMALLLLHPAALDQRIHTPDGSADCINKADWELPGH